MAKVDLQQSHVILLSKEVGQALVNQVLRNQGLNPEQHEAKFSASYRFTGNEIIASIAISEVTSLQQQQQPPEPSTGKAT